MIQRATFTGADGNTLVGDIRGEPGNQGIVFLHGGGQTRHSWGRSAEALAAAGFQTLALDHRGHGESDWVADGDYDLNRFAADLGCVAATFSSPPILVGASLGGLAAMVLEGIQAPGSCSALVLVDVIPDMDRDGVQRIKEFMSDRIVEGFASLEEAAESVAAYNPHRTKPVSTDGLQKNLRLGDDGRWRWHWDPAFMNRAFQPEEQPSEFQAVEELHAAVESIKVPMQLVRGQLSDIVKAEDAQVFIERFPHIAYVDVTDASHMVAGDKNDVFTKAVVDFIQTL